MARILIVDNYDSFTFNLSHLLEAVSGSRVDVYRNDAVVGQVLPPCTRTRPTGFKKCSLQCA